MKGSIKPNRVKVQFLERANMNSKPSVNSQELHENTTEAQVDWETYFFVLYLRRQRSVLNVLERFCSKMVRLSDGMAPLPCQIWTQR